MNISDFTNNGICSNCGECCSEFLYLDDDEIEKIDNYLKEHNITQNNKEEYNFKCPFRNDTLKKCDIYEVRPYICKMFKCDVPPEKAIITRDEINKNKKPRSMSELFFNDDSKIKFIFDNLKIKIYKRGE